MDLRQISKIFLGGDREQDRVEQGVEFLLNIAEAKIRTGSPKNLDADSDDEVLLSEAEKKAKEEEIQKEREIVLMLAG
jgi:hypothetical protein